MSYPLSKTIKSLYKLIQRDSTDNSICTNNIKQDLQDVIAKPLRFTMVIIAIIGMFFILWGGTAPLDSAVTAAGHLVLSGNRKTIQHYEGGVIKDILVHEGSKVIKNQPLIILNSASAEAAYKSTLIYLKSLIAAERRLEAEQKKAQVIDFSSPYLDITDPDTKDIVANQKQIFETKNTTLQANFDVLTKRKTQFEQKIKAYKIQLKGLLFVLDTAKNNLKDAEELLKNGIVTKLFLMEQQNKVQQLNGQVALLQADINNTEASILETEIQINNLSNEFMNKIEEEYKQIHTQRIEVEAKYQASKEILERTVIKAPVDGIVTGLQYHTIGGVIPHGVKLMEIIPEDDNLIIDAYIPLNEISHVKIGNEVKIQLNAYKQRLVPRIKGEVIYLSADRIINERMPGHDMYLIKVAINKDMLQKVNSDIKLYPGMPVTVFIIRGTRTFLQYLFAPILDSFHHAFKEA
jgi:HlyD family type I secretion membrane fusion protein